MDRSIVDLAGLAAMVALLLAATVVFWDLQTYLQDPRRKELNEAWFARFEAFRQARYRAGGLAWRADAFHGHFDRPQSPAGPPLV